MKTLALLILAFSLHAAADEASGFDTYALKCVSADSSVALEFNSGGGMTSSDQTELPLTLRIGKQRAKAEMYSYINNEGTYVDNTETDQIHTVVDLFGEAMTAAHSYDDQSQTWGALGRTIVLKPSKTITQLDLPSPRFGIRFPMSVEIREGINKRKVVLKCQGRMRSYGS